MTATTWADGFGTWHARVPATLDSVSVAREAIRAELAAREARGFQFGHLDVETVEETDETVTYREIWGHEADLVSPASRQHWIETGRFLRHGEAI